MNFRRFFYVFLLSLIFFSCKNDQSIEGGWNDVTPVTIPFLQLMSTEILFSQNAEFYNQFEADNLRIDFNSDNSFNLHLVKDNKIKSAFGFPLKGTYEKMGKDRLKLQLPNDSSLMIPNEALGIYLEDGRPRAFLMEIYDSKTATVYYFLFRVAESEEIKNSEAFANFIKSNL